MATSLQRALKKSELKIDLLDSNLAGLTGVNLAEVVDRACLFGCPLKRSTWVECA